MVKETKQSVLTVRENQDSDERMKDVSNMNKEVNFSSTIETIATMLFSDGLPQSPPSPAEVSNDDENDDYQNINYQFQEENSTNSSDGASSLSEAIQVHDMTAEIEALNDHLAEVKVDLSGETVLRRQKEKNLVKLAKQLNKSCVEINAKNEEIENVRTRECISIARKFVDI